MFAVLFCSTFAHADDPTDLKSAMKMMSADFKKIQAQVSDAKQNASTIQLSQDFGKLTLIAVSFVPQSVAALPEPAQRASEIQYEKAILELSIANLELEEALTANNQAAAIEAVKKMSADKSSGHKKFE